MEIIGHFINDEVVIEASEGSFFIYNSATGEKISQVFCASPKICEMAIIAAKKAFPKWSTTSLAKRSQILFRFRDLLSANKIELAAIVTKEHGKTLDDALGSVQRGIELVEYHCSLMQQLQGYISSNVADGVDCTTIRQPLGICAGVSPFNFPVMVPLWMLIPAIACGNTFILKPSEQDPSAALYLCELLIQAGLPKGVVNVLQGNKETVDFLINHPEIKAMTAVASTTVAEKIYQQSILQGKRAHTFGSAKNHAVVMPDANFAEAAKAIVGAAYGSAGERCMALSAVITVGNETADKLMEHMKPLIQSIKIGPGTQSGIDMGPLISQNHYARVVDWINIGIKEGADLAIDGRSFKHKQYPDGYYLAPSLFINVTPEMTIYKEEIFGPVLVVLQTNSFEDALTLVNNHQYGNGCAIFTQNGYTARVFSEQVQIGMVGINIPIPVPVASHAFGGWKRSVFGDIAMHGMESITFYTKLKSITSRWSLPTQDANAFIMPTH